MVSCSQPGLHALVGLASAGGDGGWAGCGIGPGPDLGLDEDSGQQGLVPTWSNGETKIEIIICMALYRCGNDF